MKNENGTTPENSGEIVIYESADGTAVRVPCQRLYDG